MEKSYTAITLDTSVFDGNKLRLESGLLARMSQFRDSRTKFVITNICLNELKNHLRDKVYQSKLDLEKALNEAQEHLFFDGSEFNEARKKLTDNDQINKLVENRVERYLDKTGAIVLIAEAFVSLSEVTERYFQSLAPFSSSVKKKNEFPDAIALLALEKWAKENGELIYAVSQDNDWANYSEESEFIDCYKNIGGALEYFNRAEIPLKNIKNLEDAIVKNSAVDFIRQLDKKLDSIFSSIVVAPEADSFHFWEIDCIEVSYSDFSLAEDELKIIQIQDGSIVVEAFLNIDLNAVGYFNLSQYDSIDHDHVYLGSVEKKVESSHEVRVLITVVGDFFEIIEDIEELKIEDVEVIDKIKSIDFGQLDIDYSHEFD